MRLLLLLVMFCLPLDDTFAQRGSFVSAPESRLVRDEDYNGDTLRQFYNYKWEKCIPQLARYYTYAYRENEGYHCQDYYVQEKTLITDAFFADRELKMREGKFVAYDQQGNVDEYGYYSRGMRTGWWLRFNDSARCVDSSLYLNGSQAGRCVTYYDDDGAIKEVRNMDRHGKGTGTATSFYESGNLQMTGNYSEGMKKDSTWTRYHANGKIALLMEYNKGELIRQQCFDSSGNPQKDCIAERKPEYPGGEEALKKYLYDNISFPVGLDLRLYSAYVVARFVIDEQGAVSHASIVQPLHPDFDREVLRAVKKMRKWKPGILYNEPVKVYYTLPVKFFNPKRY